MRVLMCAVLAGLVGCDIAGGACTDIAIVSVAVEVVDLDGNAIPDVDVTYTVDGGADQRAECIGDGTDCTEFWTAFETEGVFVVTASFEREDPDDPACFFSDSASTTVTVTGDECHVETQDVLIELDATQLVCASTAG